MRKYEKPVMQVERYSVKNSYCTGCNRKTIDEVVVPKENQTIYCIANSVSENCFNTATSCGHSVNTVTLDTTYYSTRSYNSLATWIYEGAKASEMDTYGVSTNRTADTKSSADAGVYVVWQATYGGKTDAMHAGLMSTEIQKLYGFSY